MYETDTDESDALLNQELRKRGGSEAISEEYWDINNGHISSDNFVLPAWMFDIEDDDNLELLNSRLTLLQELDIDPSHIIDCIAWQFKCPFFGLLKRITSLNSIDRSPFASIRCVQLMCGRVIDNSHPINIASKYTFVGRHSETTSSDDESEELATLDKHSSNVNFWGPMFIVTLFAALLWLGNQKNVPYIYVVWILGSLFAHLTVLPFLDGSTLSFHLAILGYSLCPQLPFCFIVLAFRPSVLVCSILQIIGVMWSSTAALMGYQVIVRPLIAKDEDRSKLLLLLPVVLLFELYMITLVPMRRWQINNGQPITFF